MDSRRICRHGIAAALAVIACLASSPLALSRTIAAMRVVPPSEPLQEVLDRCSVAPPGDTLDQGSLERTAALLRASGLFTTVRYTVGDGEAAEVSWTLVPQPTVSSIRISGNLFLLSSVLQQELPARAGDRYDEALPARIREAILAVYRNRGFPDAEVEVAAIPAPPFGFDLRVRVRERKPRVVRSFRFDGDAPFSDEELSVAAGIVLGGFWSERTGEEMQEALLAFLREAGYIEASCSLRAEPHEGAYPPPLDITRPFMTLAGLFPGAYPGVQVVAEVATGSRWTVSIAGAPPGLEQEVSGALTFASSGTVDAYERERSRREVRKALQEAGYFSASVEISFSWHPSPSISVNIAPGRHAPGYDIVYAGVPGDVMPALREAVRTIEADYANVTDELLGRIRESAPLILSSHGYPDAVVSAPSVSWHGERGRHVVTIAVEPATRLTLGELEVEGASSLTPREIAEQIEWRPGAPFDSSGVSAGKERLASFYRSRGNLSASIRLDLERRGSTVTGRCVVDEGPVFTNGKFAVVGNSGASGPFVLRMAGFVPGAPATPAGITAAQLSLYRTGLFSRVAVEPARGKESDPAVDYLVKVEETPHRRLNVAVGYGDVDGWRGILSLRHTSLFGGGEEGYLSAKVSQKNQEYGLGIRFPYLSRGWTAEVAAYRQRRERPSFTEEATGGRLAVGKTIARDVSVSLACRLEGYDYPELADGFSPVAGSADSGTMIGIPLTVRYDSRNNPFLPTTGLLLEGVAEYSPDVFDAGTAFTRIEGGAVSFITPWRSLTIGLSLRAGTILPESGGGEVPLRERYFLGGATSVRGYVPDHLGPKDDRGNPLGGRTMVSGSLELRFPLSPKLHGAFFVDAGGVFLDDEILWSGIGESTGVGARYLTPIGPVRLDLAWRLDAKGDEDPFRVHFTLGYPF